MRVRSNITYFLMHDIQEYNELKATVASEKPIEITEVVESG